MTPRDTSQNLNLNVSIKQFIKISKLITHIQIFVF